MFTPPRLEEVKTPAPILRDDMHPTPNSICVCFFNVFQCKFALHAFYTPQTVVYRLYTPPLQFKFLETTLNVIRPHLQIRGAAFAYCSVRLYRV